MRAAGGSPDRERLLVVGVGGQGVLTAARVLVEAGRLAGLEVVLGQLHGLTQRGGSVQSSVLYGGHSSSFLEDGAADVVLGLEPLEVLRVRAKMSGRTRVVTNVSGIAPLPLAQRGEAYPDLAWILAEIRAVAPEVVGVDAAAIATSVGARRSLNVAMLGVLAGLEVLPFPDATLWSAVEARIPPTYREANHRAFELGKKAVVTS